jgi:hypothetical protein
MFAALRDCVKAMKSTRHAKTTQVLVDAFQKETFDSFKSQVCAVGTFMIYCLVQVCIKFELYEFLL